jgi:NADP-dependent 3-hydroxy acid dehydrogenase YdfG
VLLVGRNAEKVRAAEETVNALGGGKAHGLVLDITQSDGPSRAFDAAYEAMGDVQVLVNSAGVYIWKAMLEASDEDWQRTLDTQLFAPFRMARELGRRVRARAPDTEGKPICATVINIGSIHGVVGDATVVHQCAAKAGLIGLTRAAAEALRPLGIRDEDPEVLSLAVAKLNEFQHDVETIQATIALDGEALPGSPYDLILATLALHAMVGHDIDGPEAEGRYELLFQGLHDSLMPGGHLLVGDHIGTLGLYRQMKAMERAGFTDVDCAWRQDEFVVFGGRVPD